MGQSSFYKRGYSAFSTVEEVADMGGATEHLLTFDANDRRGRRYTVEAFYVHAGARGACYGGTIHRVNGVPKVRNCHVMTRDEAIQGAVRWWDLALSFNGLTELARLYHGPRASETRGVAAVEQHECNSRALAQLQRAVSAQP